MVQTGWVLNSSGDRGSPPAASPRWQALRMLLHPAHPCSSFLQHYLCRTREVQIPHCFYPKPAWKWHVPSPGAVTARCEPQRQTQAPLFLAPCLLQLGPTSVVMLTFTQGFLDPFLRAAACPARWSRSTVGKPRGTQTFSKYALTHRNPIPGSPRGREPAMRPAPNLGAMNSLRPGLIE